MEENDKEIPGVRSTRRKPFDVPQNAYIHVHVEKDKESFIEVTPQSLRLMMELMLFGAVNDCLIYKEGKEKHDLAINWFFEEEDDLMSFRMCCVILQLNQDKVRFKVQRDIDSGRVKYRHTDFEAFLNLCS